MTGDRPRFCDQCGRELTQATPPETSSASGKQIELTEPTADQEGPGFEREGASTPSQEQNRTVYREKLKKAWSDGKVSVGELAELDALREQLGITRAQAEELWEEAIESLRPSQKDDFEEKPQGRTSYGLALSINTNQFYMQGFCGVIDIRLENLSDDPFDSIKVELSSNLLNRTEHWSHRLQPCAKVEKRFPVTPAYAGVGYIQFRIAARQGNSIYAYTAEATPLILPKVENAKDIKIQADNLVNLGQGSEKFNIGGVIDLHMEELIRLNKIKTAYDFMMEYSKRPANFEMLELVYEAERSEQLTNSLTVAETTAKGKRVVQRDRGSLTDATSLQIQSKDRPVNILLIARSTVTLGKNRQNDIVTRICPRSPVNDNQSNQIGRNHCRLELTENGMFVKDSGSINGTLLDGEAVDADGKQIKANSKGLELGGALQMSVRYVGEKRGLDTAGYENLLDEPAGPVWDLAARVGINSMTLCRLNNLGKDDKNGFESYCLVYRLATLGSDPHCSITFADKGLEPTHAVILYLGQRFYLENVSDLTDVVINETTLSKNELIPLNFGDRIRIARLDLKFQQCFQLFLST